MIEWKNTIPNRLLQHYITLILLSEIRGTVAVVPVYQKKSEVKNQKEDFHVRIYDDEAISFIHSMGKNKINIQIKNIIRWHLENSLKATSGQSFVPQAYIPVQKTSRTKPISENKLHVPKNAVEIIEKPVQPENQEDDSSDMRNALLSIGGWK